MKIIICKPGKAPELKTVRGDLTLQEMQEIVGGYIQVVRADGLPKGVVIVCNDDGKLLGLPANQWITLGGLEDLLVGTFFICKTEGEELVPLTDAEAAKIALRLGQGTMAAFDAEEPQAPFQQERQEKAKPRVPSVVDRLGQIADRVCNELCKYKAQVDEDDAAMDEICGKCPLIELC